MRLRPGRHNPYTLYLQTGDEPSDADACVGMLLDEGVAQVVADGLTSPWHLNEIKLSVEARGEGPFVSSEPESPGPSS